MVFYNINGSIEKIGHLEFMEKSDNKKIVGYLSNNELSAIQEKLALDASVLEQCKESNALVQNTLTVWESHSFVVINVLNTEEVFSKRDAIALYISKDIFLVIDLDDQDGSTMEAFEKTLREPGVIRFSMARLVSVFIRKLIHGFPYVYEKMRSNLEGLDSKSWEEISKDKTFETKISNINHELLVLYSYYQQLSDVCVELEENDNEIFTSDDLVHIHSLSKRIERYADNINLLREYCGQVRSSYHSQLDLHLNEVMKILTAITAIFLPLSIVVGWYGMNFIHMPELGWRYGYLGVILLSILIVTLNIIYFKRKNIM